MTEEDKIEWEETYQMIKEDDVVLSKLSFGEVVTLKKELFDNMVKEINDSRILFGDMNEGVDLIVIQDKDEDS